MQVREKVLRKFVNQVQEALNNRDAVRFNGLLDVKGFEKEIREELGARVMLNFRREDMIARGKTEWEQLGNQLVQHAGETGVFRFISYTRSGEAYDLVFRLLDENMYLNYFIFRCRETDEGLVIADMLDYRLGIFYREVMKLERELELRSRKTGNLLLQGLGVIESPFRLFRTLFEKIQAGDYPGALQAWHAFPADLKETQFFRFQKLRLSVRKGPETFRPALEAYIDLFAVDGPCCLIALDGCWKYGWLEQSLRYINQLDEWVGGDPALNFYRGWIYERFGHRQLAASYGQLFACAEPSIQAGFELMEETMDERGGSRAFA